MICLGCCDLSSDLIVTRAKPGSRAARAEQHEGGSCREGLTCVRWSVGSISLPRVQHLERFLTGALVGTVLTEFFSGTAYGDSGWANLMIER